MADYVSKRRMTLKHLIEPVQSTVLVFHMVSTDGLGGLLDKMKSGHVISIE